MASASKKRNDRAKSQSNFVSPATVKSPPSSARISLAILHHTTITGGRGDGGGGSDGQIIPGCGNDELLGCGDDELPGCGDGELMGCSGTGSSSRCSCDEGDESDKGDEGDEGDKGDEGDEGDEGDVGDEGDEGDVGDEGELLSCELLS